MKRIIVLLCILYGFGLTAQVKLALCPNLNSAASKNMALVTILLMKYKGEDWYKTNIFDPYYSQLKGLRWQMYVYYDGIVKIFPNKRIPKEIQQAFYAIEDSLMQNHYTIYGAINDMDRVSSGERENENFYSEFIINDYAWKCQQSQNLQEELGVTDSLYHDSYYMDSMLIDYPQLKPVFTCYINLNPFECLNGNFFTPNTDSTISYYEFIKSSAIYNYIMPAITSQYNEYEVEISNIIKN